MNRAKGGGWEFLEVTGLPGFTWTPASGCSGEGCAVRARGVCWAEKIVKRLGHICPLCPTFKPHMHDGSQGTPDRVKEPLQRRGSAVITPVSTGDLFGLPVHMTSKILNVIEAAAWHTFAVLTKMPQSAHRFSPYPDNVWFGVTVNEQADTWRLDELTEIEAPVRWTIFEPLYSAIDHDLSWLDWIVIGPQTRPEMQPKRAWIQSILDNAPGVPVFMKSTLEWDPKRREGPRLSSIWKELEKHAPKG